MSNIIDLDDDVMLKDEIKETNFREGLEKKEKKEIHREIITRAIIQRHNCKISDIIFSNEHGFVIDDIISFKGKINRIEYKMDYWTAKTNNIVFELISAIPITKLPKVSGYKFSSKHPDFKKITDLVQSVSRGEIEGAKASRHLAGEQFEYYFSYVASKKEDRKSVV